MKYILYLLAIVILLGLNVGFFGQLRFFGTVPNLLFLATAALALEKQVDYLLFAFVAGLFLDFYSSVPIGSYCVAFLLIGLTLNYFSYRVFVYRVNWKYFTAITVIAFLGLTLFTWAYGKLFAFLGWHEVLVPFSVLVKTFLPQVAYNLLLLYPVYVFVFGLRRFIAAFSPRRQ